MNTFVASLVTDMRKRLASLDTEYAQVRNAIDLLESLTSDAPQQKPAKKTGRYKYRGIVRSSLLDIIICWVGNVKPTWDEVITQAIRHAQELHHRRVPRRVMRQGMHTLRHEKIIGVDKHNVVTLLKARG